MAARDNLGGQFGSSKPQQIPAHHRDAILHAINSMGERGMELVPGGMHVTPSDGGKSHFIPHADTELHINTSRPDGFSLHSKAPTEGAAVRTFVLGDRSLGPYIRTSVAPLPVGSTAHATSMREAHDDPAHLLDRKHDSVLSNGRNTMVVTFGGSPRSYYQPHLGNEINSGETLSRLPHLGGNPKDPAQSLSTSLGQKGMTSEDIDAIKGLHRAWSHVYDVDEHQLPYISDGPADFRRDPFRSRDRHVFPVFVDDDENPENSTAYIYNTTNGQIIKDFFDD